MPDQDPGERQARPPATGGAGRGRRWLATLLVLVVVGGIGYFLLQQPPPPPSGGEGPEPAATAPAGADGNPANATSMKPHGTTARRVRAAQDPDDLAAHAIPGEPAPTMGEVIEGLHRAGIRSGLGAFNPPGTSPPLVGLAVPDDYVLPEGYVRHHQATDDGQPIEPILMYSPDYEFVDAAGQPLAIPADRVVPPQHAPPGLPIRQIRIPPPHDPDSPP